MARATLLQGAAHLDAYLARHPRALVVGARLGTPRADALLAALGEVLGKGIALAVLDTREHPDLARDLGLGGDPQLLFHRRGKLVMRELVPRCEPEQLRRLAREAAPAWERHLGKAPTWPLRAA